MKEYFKIVKDFPKPGISFVDVNSVLNNQEWRFYVETSLQVNIRRTFASHRVDKIVGIESRGFLFLNSIADEYECGVVLARKPGKLPGEVQSISYGTEYSKDILEIQVSSIKPGDRVIIHDDILATGGTARAVAILVEQMGGEVLGYSFIGEIKDLEGRKLLGNSTISCPYQF